MKNTESLLSSFPIRVDGHGKYSFKLINEVISDCNKYSEETKTGSGCRRETGRTLVGK